MPIFTLFLPYRERLFAQSSASGLSKPLKAQARRYAL
jgi:hypothetical protein